MFDEGKSGPALTLIHRAITIVAPLKRSLPAGAPVELALHLDRGGRLGAQARVMENGQVFDDVIHLSYNSPAPEDTEKACAALRTRLEGLRGEAFAAKEPRLIQTIGALERRRCELERELTTASAGDLDASMKTAHVLSDLDAQMAELEVQLAWPKLQEEIESQANLAISWVSVQGTDRERQALDSVLQTIARAQARKDAAAIRRQLQVLRRLAYGAFHRHPDAWQWEFDYASSRLSEMSDLAASEKLVQQGRAAAKSPGELEGVVRMLWALLPPEPEERARSYESGVV